MATTLCSLVLITATPPRYFCLPIVIPAQAGIQESGGAMVTE